MPIDDASESNPREEEFAAQLHDLLVEDRNGLRMRCAMRALSVLSEVFAHELYRELDDTRLLFEAMQNGLKVSGGRKRLALSLQERLIGVVSQHEIDNPKALAAGTLLDLIGSVQSKSDFAAADTMSRAILDLYSILVEADRLDLFDDWKKHSLGDGGIANEDVS